MTDEQRAVARGFAVRDLIAAGCLDTLTPTDDQLRAAVYLVLHKHVRNDAIHYLIELFNDRPDTTTRA